MRNGANCAEAGDWSIEDVLFVKKHGDRLVHAASTEKQCRGSLRLGGEPESLDEVGAAQPQERLSLLFLGRPVGAGGNTGAKFVGGEQSGVRQARGQLISQAGEQSVQGSGSGGWVGSGKCGCTDSFDLRQAEICEYVWVIAGAADGRLPHAARLVGDYQDNGGRTTVPSQAPESSNVVCPRGGLRGSQQDFEGVGTLGDEDAVNRERDRSRSWLMPSDLPDILVVKESFCGYSTHAAP